MMFDAKEYERRALTKDKVLFLRCILSRVAGYNIYIDILIYFVYCIDSISIDINITCLGKSILLLQNIDINAMFSDRLGQKYIAIT